ncbi:stimulus-sensing domain-containing protein [Camelimonas abortus]|uniref:histidine kinase n=1 Tax=Camelimonas abortus TaxID=1017184 RepID=A0ABV7LC93_9HYPH
MDADDAGEETGAESPLSLPACARQYARLLLTRMSSSLTRRIVMLNLAGLVVLLVGFLYLNQFREGLIEARVQSLLTQGEIIAGAIATSATVETDAVQIDPDKLLQLQAGESAGPLDEPPSPLEFSINPERVAPLLRHLVTPTGTRARVYDREGQLLIDSQSHLVRGDVLRLDLPPIPREPPGWLDRLWEKVRGWMRPAGLPAEVLTTTNGRSLPEVVSAMSGKPASVVRVNSKGETIVSVAVPIQRLKSVRGVLLLSTQGGDIDQIIAKERLGLLQVFLIAALVMVLLSFLLAGAIAGPIRRLAEAADRVRRGVRARQSIPDFTSRADEIGHLSGALRDMTTALYNRIDAIESFAADVAHELKNPLTSLRSAVETLPLAKTDESRGRLLEIIQHDVKRLDRLISDISDASRLDAELSREDSEPVDVAGLVEGVASIANEVRRDGQAPIELFVEPHPLGRDAFMVMGHGGRLGQVINNLVDNARSFSPEGATVRIYLRRLRHDVEVRVEDDGPGIPEHALERIFERFYTDRPHGFGQNSGLGLSISRQIVSAHKGSITARNRRAPAAGDVEGKVLGATFVVRLPALVAQ